jgi:hypothetical protein
MMNTLALSRSRMYLLRMYLHVPAPSSPDATHRHHIFTSFEPQLFTNTPGSRLTTCAFRIDVFCCTSAVSAVVYNNASATVLYSHQTPYLSPYIPINASREKHETLLHSYVCHTYVIRSYVSKFSRSDSRLCQLSRTKSHLPPPT